MITHVAIRISEGKYFKVLHLPAPNRHHNIIHNYFNDTGQPIPDDNIQGFLDERGIFYTRKQALVHALKHNQVKDVKNIRMNMLFSEDVW